MEYKPLEQEAPQDFSPVNREEIAESLYPKQSRQEYARLASASLGTSYEEELLKIETELSPRVDKELQLRASKVEQEDLEFNLAANLDKSVEELTSVYDTLTVKGSLKEPSVALLTANTEYGQLYRKQFRRAITLDRMLAEKFAEINTGTLDTIGEVADLLVSDGILNVLGNTEERINLSKQLGALYSSPMSDDEYVAEVQKIFRQAEDQGLFTDQSSIYFQMLLANAAEGGIGDTSAMDQAFATLDTVTAGATAIAGLRKTFKAGNAAARVARLKSSEEAMKMVDTSVLNGESGAGVVKNTSVKALLPANTNSSSTTGFELRNSQFLEYMGEKFSNFKGVLEDDQFGLVTDAFRTKFVEDLKSSDKARLLDVDLEVDPMKNYSGVAYLGTTKGKLYKTVEQAQKVADRFGAEVVESPELLDGKVGYVIKITDNIDPKSFVEGTNPDEILGRWYAPLLSTTARTDPRLDSVRKWNEGQSSIVSKFTNETYTASRKKVGKQAAKAIDDLLTELRDDIVDRTDYWTEAEFSRKYKERTGFTPTDEVIDHYYLMQDYDRLGWLIQSDSLLKRAVSNGEGMFNLEESWFRGKLTPEVVQKVKAYDLDSKQFVDTDKNVLSVADGAFRIDDKPVKWVTASSFKKRAIKHADVMGFTPGGRRMYDRAKYYIKQDTGDILTATGGSIRGNPRTFMAVVTEKEALQAVEEFNNLVDWIVKSGITDPKDLMKNSEFSELVLKNNNWNTNIQDAEDFVMFANEWDLDITKKVGKAFDGDPLDEADTVNFSSMGEYVSFQGNKSRTKKPLLGFGGEMAETLRPSEALDRSTAVALNAQAERAYVYRAASAWLKAAPITNRKLAEGMSPLQVIKDERFTLPNDTLGRKFEQERQLIISKMGYKTRDMKAWDGLVDKLADYVYDKGGKRIDRNIRQIKDPASTLRSFAFNMKLGLFAWDQVMVQASQVVNIMGISPVNGIRGTALVGPIRMALYKNDPTFTKHIAKLAAPVVGMKPEDFEEVVQFIQLSGRNIVDNNIIELDGNQSLYKGYMKTLLDKGRVFFNEGELIARISANATAVMDFKRQFKDVDIFSDAGKSWIIERQDVLTASMSSASAATWQRSMASVPLQFMTYHIRMLEQVFLSNTLTKAERARMIGSLGFFWGSAGIGTDYLVDRIFYETGEDINPEVVNLVKYGMVDFALSNLTGSDTALATRLGVGAGFTDVVKRIVEDGFIEVLQGPSGGIAGDTFSSPVTELAINMFSGNFDIASYDLTKLARNVTSFNRGFNAWMAWNYEQALSRKDRKVLLDNLDKADAFSMLMGVPLKESETSFIFLEGMKREDEYFKEFANKFMEKREIMEDYIDKGDDINARAVSDEMSAMFNTLTGFNQQKLLRWLKRNRQDMFGSLYEAQIRRGNKSAFTRQAEELRNGS